MTADHLVECGHRNIGIVMDGNSCVHLRRFNGYPDSDGHGLQVSEDTIVNAQGREECTRRSLMLHLGRRGLCSAA